MARLRQYKHWWACVALLVTCLMILPLRSLRFQGTAEAFHFPWDQGHDTFTPNNPNDPDTPPDPPNDPCGGTGSPVYLATGGIVLTYTDIAFNTLAGNLKLCRTYNSQDDRKGPFGTGWSTNLGMQAIPVSDGRDQTVIIRMANGQRYRFVKNPDGTFASPPGSSDRLALRTDGIYVLSLSRGGSWEFHPDLGLSAVVDRNGNRVTLEYDATLGILETVTDVASGRQIRFTLGPNGKIASVTGPLDTTSQYSYDAAGRLTAVTDPAGNTTQYQYDTRDRLTQVTDPRGVVLMTAAYDANDRATSYSELGASYTMTYQTGRTLKRDSGNLTWTYDLTPQGLVRKITDPLGNSITRTIDDQGRLLSETDPNGFTTTYAYDSRGNVTTVTDAGGNVQTYAYHPQFDLVTSYTDALGVSQTYEYDARGNLSRVVTDPGGPVPVTVSYEYDAQGRMTRFVDGRGSSWRFEHDARGYLSRRIDPLANFETRTYDDLGRLLSMTDPLGRTSSFEYDPVGRLTAAVGPLGERTTLVWDASGNLAGVTDAAGNTSTIEYNNRNLPVRFTDPEGRVVQRTYLLRNNLMATVTDAEGKTVTYAYDNANRLATVTDALSRTLTYTFDKAGVPVQARAANGSTVKIAYNYQRQPVQVTDPLGKVTSYTYDARGLRTSRTDANGHVTSFTYDRLGRLATVTDPLNRVWTYAHDASGNLISRRDPLGRTIQLTYDAASRLVTTRYPDDSTATRGYDAVGNLTELTDPFTSLRLTYDARNRLVELTDQRLGKSVTYEYDAAGRRTEMVTPEGIATTYEYNGNNQLVRATRGSEVTQWTYNLDRTLAAVILPNGTRKEMSYDAANQQTGIVHRTSGGAVLQSFGYTYNLAGAVERVVRENGDTITYGYDAAQRLVSEQRTGNVAYSHRYTYDSVGNRLTYGSGCSGTTCTQNTGYTYDAADQLLRETRPTAVIDYTYDANGNLTSRSDGAQVWDFSYDFENRLVAVDAPGTADDARFEYDADGKRITQVVGGVTRRFFHERADVFYLQSPMAKAFASLDRWTTGTNVLGEYDDAGTLLAGYLNGLEIDEPIARQAGGSSQYYLTDRLGSITGTVDAGQTLVNRYNYSGYGVLEQVTESQENPFQFTAREHDGSAGLYFLRMRYYDPTVGRFLSRDPLMEILDRTQQLNEESSPLFRQAHSPHAYGYASDSPTNVTDPTGTSLIVVCSLGLPICSAAVFCSANAGACSGGLICSGSVGACSAALICSGQAAGVCSAGLMCSGQAVGACSGGGAVCSGNAGGACSAAVVCSGQLGNGLGACSAAGMLCSGQVGVVGAAACSANLAGACSGQAGAVGAAACSLNLAGACSGQLGGQVSVCSVQVGGACSGQASYGPGGSACSAQFGGGCSAQYSGGPGPSGAACSAQLGSECSGQTGSSNFACSFQYNGNCSAQVSGACSAQSQGSCSAQVDASGNCCATLEKKGKDDKKEVLAALPPEEAWRQVVSSLNVERGRGDEVSIAWTLTPSVRGGAFHVLRWNEASRTWSAVGQGELRPGRVHEVEDRSAGTASYVLELSVDGRQLQLGPFNVAETGTRG